jgi:hypothetical protein
MAVELLAGEIKEGESGKAIIACNDWLRLGSGRSLPALEARYRKKPQNTAPTRSLNTLQNWSKTYGWQERAGAYDQAIDAEKTATNEARRKEIMESGLALDFERVNELNEVYEKLKLEFVRNGLWYTDTKLSATGAIVEVEVFNKPLIDSLRATLDDLAKETGGRKQKTETEHSGVMGFKFIEGVSENDR